jgi:hypothetical protein
VPQNTHAPDPPSTAEPANPAWPPGASAAAPSISIQVLTGVEPLSGIVAEWEELAASALEPNPSSEAWMLIPAIRHLDPTNSVMVVVMRASDPAPPHRSKLCAVFALQERTTFRGRPLRRICLWDHIYALSPAPLIHRELAEECVRRLLQWIADEWPSRALVEFQNLRADSPFCCVVLDVLRADGFEHGVAGIYARAFFRPAAHADEYLNSIGTSHSRKEWRRLERRLAEVGDFRYDLLDNGEDTSAWVDEFVALEMKGWKGKQGTAFGQNPEHRAYLSEIARAAQHRGQLMMLAMRLDDRPVAMKLNFLSRPGGFAFKIAFDEDFAKYTPGTLLELENIRRIHGAKGVEWMDSLAAPKHPMIDRLWRDRAAMITLLISPHVWSSEFLLAALPLLRMFGRKLSRWRHAGP